MRRKDVRGVIDRLDPPQDQLGNQPALSLPKAMVDRQGRQGSHAPLIGKTSATMERVQPSRSDFIVPSASGAGGSNRAAS